MLREHFTRERLSRTLVAALALGGVLGGGWWAAEKVSGQDGTPGSVEAGRQVYEMRCMRCHRESLQGAGRFPPLVGRPTVPDYPNAKVLYDYILRTMPYDEPNLTPEQALSVVAFLLNRNELLPDDGVLTFEMLRGFRLPGADPTAPDLPGAPETPQVVTPGSSQGNPVIRSSPSP